MMVQSVQVVLTPSLGKERSQLVNIDDCNVVMRNVFTVASDATNSPKLTISTGGVLTLEDSTSTVIGS